MFKKNNKNDYQEETKTLYMINDPITLEMGYKFPL